MVHTSAAPPQAAFFRLIIIYGLYLNKLIQVVEFIMKPEEHVKNLAAIAKRLLNETDDMRSFKAQYHLMK